MLNGIAYDAAGDRLFVTGKLWPRVFEIKLVPRERTARRWRIPPHGNGQRRPQRAQLDIHLLGVDEIDRAALQQRIRDDAVREEHRRGGVVRVVDRLPPVPPERRAHRFSDVTTTIETR